MFTIAKREFLALFKSFKSVAIVLLFVVFAFSISNFVKSNPALFLNESSNPYVSGIRFLTTVFGFLFVLTLSHDVLNREVESQTIRFVVTKISKSSIVVGKYIGVSLFWIVCLSISFTVIFISIQRFDILEFLRLLTFISYAIGINFLITTLVSKTSYSMFISLLGGILFPTFGIWSMFSSNSILQVVKYVTPFHYITLMDWKSYLPFAFSLLFLMVSIYTFRRKDL
ncbi:ABC transporter permease subunit [Paenibacillus sp. UMB4589-SE434]|nr:ABC transporter permease subunit [Paenibacillus sp. ACRRX]MDK8182775.1 ABC transporter permease subunit [Paenibacillus sp. UMB4589-SE434]